MGGQWGGGLNREENGGGGGVNREGVNGVKIKKIEKWNVTFYETSYVATVLNRKCDIFGKKVVNFMTNLSKKIHYNWLQPIIKDYIGIKKNI